MCTGAHVRSCRHDLEPHRGLTHTVSYQYLSHSLSVHSQPSSSSTRSCPESVPSFAEDNHVDFTGTLQNTGGHMSSVSHSHHIYLHSPHYSPYTFQPTFCYATQLPSVCLLGKLALYLLSPDCFKLVSIDYFHILHQTFRKKLFILYFI